MIYLQTEREDTTEKKTIETITNRPRDAPIFKQNTLL